MSDPSTNNEKRQPHAENAPQVRQSQFLGLQLQKHLCDDGIEIIPVQPALQTTPIEHLCSQSPLQIAYGGEKEVYNDGRNGDSLVSEKKWPLESSRSALLTAVACVSALTVLALIVSLVYTQHDNEAHRSPMFVLLYHLKGQSNKLIVN